MFAVTPAVVDNYPVCYKPNVIARRVGETGVKVIAKKDDCRVIVATYKLAPTWDGLRTEHNQSANPQVLLRRTEVVATRNGTTVQMPTATCGWQWDVYTYFETQWVNANKEGKPCTQSPTPTTTATLTPTGTPTGTPTSTGTPTGTPEPTSTPPTQTTDPKPTSTDTRNPAPANTESRRPTQVKSPTDTTISRPASVSVYSTSGPTTGPAAELPRTGPHDGLIILGWVAGMFLLAGTSLLVAGRKLRKH